MDQKEIDSLFSQGSITEFNKKQEELIQNLSTKEKREAAHKKGKVIGQLSKVTEESEAGTNMVMGYLENVLSVISKQQSFIKDILVKYKENPSNIYTDEVLSYLDDNNMVIEDLIFSAMDAFQFQDIGRQKLMKVMYTLARLNEYLNELLGGEENKEKAFGHQIEKRTLEKDKDKELVDNIIGNFKEKENESKIKQNPFPPPPTASSKPSTQFPLQKPAPTPKEESIKKTPPAVQTNAEVDDIIAEFQKKQKKPEEQNEQINNDDIDSIIAEFQRKNKQP